MSTPIIKVTLDSPHGDYLPGGQLTGKFQIDGPQPTNIRSAELSVLWYTMGKGEEDMAVHHFERLVDEPPAKPLDLRTPRSFSTLLPPSPLSYDGEIVKVCWCVRLRLFLPQGQEGLAEVPFRLGNVPPAKATSEEATEGTKESIV